jgi:hypothetical protein
MMRRPSRDALLKIHRKRRGGRKRRQTKRDEEIEQEVTEEAERIGFNMPSVATTLTRLRDLALAFPRPDCDWEDRPRFNPPATSQSIAEIELSAGFDLPDDLRAFLNQTESIVAMSVHNGYWLGDIKQLVGGSFPRLVEGEAVLPVATDGGGNAFFLGASGRVWRWDHETGKVRLISASFAAFLERIADDWEAYASETPNWQFLT